MYGLRREGTSLVWEGYGERLLVRPWGPDAVRVTGHVDGIGVANEISALLPVDVDAQPAVAVTKDGGTLVNGALTVELSAAGALRFVRTGTGEELLAEQPAHFVSPSARTWHRAGRSDGHALEVRFRSYAGEHFYGLGQHQHGLLDQKGAVIDLVQRNTEVSVPFLISTRGYGFLWNNPAIGRVELGSTATRWVSQCTRRLDYWIVVGDDAAGILSRYADATGHALAFPGWASGLWQSKLRYESQEELLHVARENHRRGIPLSVIVCDFFHWTRQGDWRFDPAEWPDPDGMIAELRELGVRLLVSIWPTVNPDSENYAEMLERGLLVTTEGGVAAQLPFVDKGSSGRVFLQHYDPTNPEARDYIWSKVKSGYYEHGARVWWLDACEPEVRPEAPEQLRYYAGPGLEVANVFPREHERAFFEGMRAAGEDEIILLCRSAWAGSQRYGVAVWSGDIPATFESLRTQIPAGLNLSLSGIPWWGTDIGGFFGGASDDPEFRELLVRWFQYSVFCPLLRMHGHRLPAGDPPVDSIGRPLEAAVAGSGGPNELWSYGRQVYEILRGQVALRERLRPYLHEQMAYAEKTGVPPMRALPLEFPGDPACAGVADEFCFGPDLLVAPVTEFGARSRRVYLPAGPTWTEIGEGRRHEGGAWVDAGAPLDRIPLFVRDDAPIASCFLEPVNEGMGEACT